MAGFFALVPIGNSQVNLMSGFYILMYQPISQLDEPVRRRPLPPVECRIAPNLYDLGSDR